MSEINKTAKYAAIYAAGVFLNRAVSFIMLPIYTRCLTPADYGTLELLTMIIDVFAMIAGFGLTASIYRFYYKFTEQQDRNRVISTIVVLLICFYFMASAVGIMSSEKLARYILEPGPQNTFYVRLIFLCFFATAFIEAPLIYIKAQQRPYLFVIVGVCKLIIQLSLNIYFVVMLQMHVLGVLYSTLIASMIVGTVLIIYTFKTAGFGFSRKLARSMLIFGAPLIIANFGDFILTFSDRYFLKIYSDLTTVGIYSLGYKLGFILWAFAARPIFSIWNPQRFDIVKSQDVQEINRKAFFFLNFILICCSLGISLFSLDLFRIMSAPDFWDAYKIVPLIMVAYIIQGWTVFCNFGVMYSGKTKYMAIATLISAASIIVFSFLLIPKYSGYGAALATILAFFVRFQIVKFYSQRIYRLELPWAKSILLLGIATIIYLLSLYFQQANIILSIMLNSFLFMVFFIVILIPPIFDKKEKMFVINFIRHPLATLKNRGR